MSMFLRPERRASKIFRAFRADAFGARRPGGVVERPDAVSLASAFGRLFRQHAAEGAPVDGAAAVLAQRRPMLARAVADVAREAVVRVDRVVLAHEAVAVGLGEDGGGRDGGRD